MRGRVCRRGGEGCAGGEGRGRMERGRSEEVEVKGCMEHCSQLV